MFTADEKNLMRADVQALVNAKPSRLKMIITDACNNETESMTASRSLSRGAAGAMEGKYDAVYKELLYKYQGMMHLSASSEGQYAWSQDHLGGYFTHYFFKEGLIKNPSTSWEAIFKMAREKTSQMFRLMPDEQKRQLASDGINDQTAKAYAMPKAGSAITVAPAVNQNTAPIVIWNATQKNISFFLDKNTDMNQWVPAKLEKKLASPNASLQLKGPKATIGFTNGKEEIYYDLESGNYFFDYNEFNQLDLFVDEEGVERDDVSKKDYAKLMTGEWEYLDENESIRMTFDASGSFHEESAGGELLTEGSWKISQVEDPEEKKMYPVMVFSQQEDGAQVDLHYLIVMDDGIVQLVYFAGYVDGQYIEEEEEESGADDSESVILLYKAR